MKKVFLICGLSFILGVVSLIGGVAVAKGNKIFVDNSVQKTADIAESFTSVKLDMSSDYVEVLPSVDESAHLDWFEDESDKLIYGVESGVLKISRDHKFYFKDIFKINFNFKAEEKAVKIYIPQKNYESMEIFIASGHINVKSGIIAENVNLKCSSGKIYAESIKATTFLAKVTSGEINAKNIEVVTGNLSVVSGNIFLANIKAESLVASVTTGGMKIEKADAKAMTLSVTSGSMKAEEIKTDGLSASVVSGEMTLKFFDNFTPYHVTAKASSGNVRLYQNGVKTNTASEESSWGNGAKNINAKVSSGNISLYFK